MAVLFGAFYGLRRSEIVGLKWDAIDFKDNTIVIRHTVTTCTLDGKKLTISKDRTKNVASLRSLPLVPVFCEKLLALKNSKRKTADCSGSPTVQIIWITSMWMNWVNI